MVSVLRKLIGRSIEEPAGCGFLSPEEIETWLEGGLGAARGEAFKHHQETGCSRCALLAADLEVFNGVVARGLLESERREFQNTEAVLRAQLRQKLESHEPERVRARSSRFSWNYALATATAAMLLGVVALPLFWQREVADAAPTLSLPGGGVYEVRAIPFSERPAMRGEVSVKELWSRAGEAYGKGDFAAAEPLFAVITQRRPVEEQTYDAFVSRGSCLVMLQRYDRAIEVLEEALGLADEFGFSGADANYLLGVAAWRLDDRDRATRALTAARSAGGHFGQEAATLLGLLGQ